MRSLDKQIAKLGAFAGQADRLGRRLRSPRLGPTEVEKILGKPQLPQRRATRCGGIVGVVTGLAWTEVGGDILYIESVLTPGQGPPERSRAIWAT